MPLTSLKVRGKWWFIRDDHPSALPNRPHTPIVDPLQLAEDIGPQITEVSARAIHIQGGFGDVFAGMHETAGRVALKRPRLSSEDEDQPIIDRFLKEADTWRRLDHPYVLRFLGIGRIGGYLHLVSPYIKNGTLLAYIILHPEADRPRLLRETADAITFLHKSNIVHGDIKANNILVSDNVHALLCDFGLSKMANSKTSLGTKSAGTTRWKSPELWDDVSRSFSSDAYAFGITIAEVLTGDRPFPDCTDDIAVMKAVYLNRRRPTRPTFPPATTAMCSYIWDIAELCWVTDCNERPAMWIVHCLLEQPTWPSTHPLIISLAMGPGDAGDLISPSKLREHIESQGPGIYPPSAQEPERKGSASTMLPGSGIDDEVHTPSLQLHVESETNTPDLDSGSTPQTSKPRTPIKKIASQPSTIREYANLAADLATLPGLAPSVQALETIYLSTERVPYQRAKCRILASKASEILYIIRDNAMEADEALLRKAVRDTNSILNNIRNDVGEWCKHGFWTSWYLRHDINSSIETHEDSLKEVTNLIQGANLVQIRSQVKKWQKVLKSKPSDTPEYRTAQEQLGVIRSTADKAVLLRLPQKLAGECVKIGSRPAISGSAYDIWEGLWLGRMRVALKFNKEFRVGVEDKRRKERFEREVDNWRQLDSPFVLRLYGWCKMDEDDVYLVSPWMENGNVKMYLAKKRSETEELVRLIREIALGLEYLRDHGSYHGALRPSNVLVEDEGHAVISGFALSKMLPSFGEYSNSETTNFRYEPPEGMATSTAGDVYSWAMTALEIVSGLPPYYQFKSPGALMTAIFADGHLPQRKDHLCEAFDAYPDLWEILVLCWNREQGNRPTIETILKRLMTLRRRGTLRYIRTSRLSPS